MNRIFLIAAVLIAVSSQLMAENKEPAKCAIPENYDLINNYCADDVAAVKTCPMPELGLEINKAYEECRFEPDNPAKAGKFVELLKKAMQKYDCKRDYDVEPVPAWWLEDPEVSWNWLKLLSTLTTKEARKFFDSAEFRNTLDGEYAEWYKDLKASRKKGKK